MSTRAIIAVEQPDGSVDAIYCVTNGWPNGPFGVGFLLQERWNTTQLANQLVQPGNLASLGSHLGTPGPMPEFNDDTGFPEDAQNYYLGRDYGRPSQQMARYQSVDEFARQDPRWMEFAYLFVPDADDGERGEWRYSHCAHRRTIPGTTFEMSAWTTQPADQAGPECCICSAEQADEDGPPLRLFDSARRICETCFAERYPPPPQNGQ